MKTKHCSEGPGVSRPSNPEPESLPPNSSGAAKIDNARRHRATTCFSNFPRCPLSSPPRVASHSDAPPQLQRSTHYLVLGFHTLSLKINELRCKTSFFFCIDQLLFAFLRFSFFLVVVAEETTRSGAFKC